MTKLGAEEVNLYPDIPFFRFYNSPNRSSSFKKTWKPLPGYPPGYQPPPISFRIPRSDINSYYCVKILRKPIEEYLTDEFYRLAQEKQYIHLFAYYRELGLDDFIEDEYLFRNIVLKIFYIENSQYKNIPSII